MFATDGRVLEAFAADCRPWHDDGAMPDSAQGDAHVRGIAPQCHAKQFAVDLAIVIVDCDRRADRNRWIVEGRHGVHAIGPMM